MPQPNLIDFLYEAMTSDIGIIVEADDPLLLRTRLYAIRAKDPLLSVLSLVLSPTNPTNELWILKSKPIPDDKVEL